MRGCELDPLFERGERSVNLPLDVLPNLPPCFEETLLGDPKGAKKQFRCYHGYHVRVYDDHYEIHADKFDPRISPALHLMFDTPLMGVIVGYVLFKKLFGE
ncbi:hypothetical protein B9Q01_04270 [Candidatus Marsarchaeota G1 archaeon OSP_D]|jgi:hypothetical protein|uniref:Uncharacterized protein n=3 Tax=Candidatus Marsarchaeota group 1 TaxID=2203770 RepID=A0A2R6AET6_9ARCH|nr:MAG: hypothetical protein B9Q01_04270 [Candidatus Marsarchaeota G1 archaeon OSP_D]PSN84833.1 MAG: hypothetical protein B9Q02_08610 [Candidatus Marsarchaeota G1 archaeon BE_D]PSN89264.1 MAG: hypothetical protein B9Q00_01895 [Candidatus Marsarchaeota G1 archaeon OSP_C]